MTGRMFFKKIYERLDELMEEETIGAYLKYEPVGMDFAGENLICKMYAGNANAKTVLAIPGPPDAFPRNMESSVTKEMGGYSVVVAAQSEEEAWSKIRAAACEYICTQLANQGVTMPGKEVG